MQQIFHTRLANLMGGIGEGECAFITSDINIHYFTGFPSSEGIMFVSNDYACLLVDFRYIESAQEQVTSCDVILCHNRLKKLRELVKSHNIGNILLESDSLDLRTYIYYKDGIVNASFDTSLALFEKIKAIRIIKDSFELDRLRKAQLIAEKAYTELLNYLKAGVTERSLAVELEHLMKQNGAERTAFDLITIAGENTSRPHGVPTDYRIQAGDFVTFDIGAVYEGYHSDMTRTVAVAYADDEKRQIYQIVKDAQQQALDFIKEGVSGLAVDNVARSIITDAGYGEQFGHSTGHGVGLQIHEYPNLSTKSKDILKSGMVVTVEPGIYLPKKFGVRIEDTVCVTKQGYENLAHITKDLIIIK